MKKGLLVLGAIMVLALLLSSCNDTRHGVAIVGYSGSQSRGEEVRALPFERERYIYTAPNQVMAFWDLVMADEVTGQYLPNVDYTLANPELADLVQADGAGTVNIKRVIAKALGETIVTAFDHDSGLSDDATLVVYPGYRLSAFSGIKLSTRQKTSNPNEADVWINSTRSEIVLPGGFTRITDYIETGVFIIDRFDQIVGTLEQVGPPGTISDINSISTQRLYLIKSRDGGLYAAIMSVAGIAFKEIIPPPAP